MLETAGCGGERVGLHVLAAQGRGKAETACQPKSYSASTRTSSLEGALLMAPVEEQQLKLLQIGFCRQPLASGSPDLSSAVGRLILQPQSAFATT